MKKKLTNQSTIAWTIGISTLVFFLCSSIRHILFQSTVFDLGFFTQAAYLISQGKPPISSYLGVHILGDHAAWIWYPLSLFYKIHQTVYWLFLVQAFSLALGVLPTWLLALQAGLKESQAVAVSFVYLLYPVVFNINLFDFHPEVMALPALLIAVWFARKGKIIWFCASIIFILGCKAVLSLTVLGMGVWLLIFEKRRWCGGIAILAGVSWFTIATQLIMPAFTGQEALSVGRYSYLGDSILEIATNLVLKPGLIFGKVFSLANLEYLILLILPIVWGLSWVSIQPLIPAIPCVALNLLADYQAQKDLVHQYSLPALPFLILAVIASLTANKAWLQKPKYIILWSLITFLCLAKFTHFGSIYLQTLDTWQATREALNRVQTSGNILTTAAISPHLSHRQLIHFTEANNPPTNLKTYDYVLLNVRHPGWASNQEFATTLVNQLKNRPEFKLSYQRDDVYLFQQQ